MSTGVRTSTGRKRSVDAKDKRAALLNAKGRRNHHRRSRSARLLRSEFDIDGSGIRMAGLRAADKAMSVMGYLVVQQGEWIVRKFPDGSTEKLKKINKSINHKPLRFD